MMVSRVYMENMLFLLFHSMLLFFCSFYHLLCFFLHTKCFLMKEFHPKQLEAYFYARTIVGMLFWCFFQLLLNRLFNLHYYFFLSADFFSLQFMKFFRLPSFVSNLKSILATAQKTLHL